jgi:hypothetical protein
MKTKLRLDLPELASSGILGGTEDLRVSLEQAVEELLNSEPHAD